MYHERGVVTHLNPFVFACMTPHGSEIIEELSKPNPALMETTRGSMERLGTWMREANPECIIVLTPHGLRVDGQFSISDSERMYGEVEDHGEKVSMERKVDRELAREIADAARASRLPIASLNFATAEGPYSCLPLDWGVIVPLYFMPEVPIVVITPSRSVGYREHVMLGKAIAEAVGNSGKRVGLIASCDWAHAHNADGPYGFNESAERFDTLMVEFIENNRIEALADLPMEFVDEAKPDGIWQAMILAGAIRPADRKVEVLSYEVPTYFGLLCTAYHG